MFDWMKRAVSKSPSLNAAMGDVLVEAQQVRGQTADGHLQWRVKRGLDGRLYVGAKIKADAYAGEEGRPNNFINFDLQAAEKLRAELDSCIEELRRLGAAQQTV
ncbi:hypothetical protein LJR090_000075 [Bosea sp. LjRoot90]|uniref:hypothetical protein n=1 Tax=Bosea sp. LjRoot90 TaxID=3342342 RepID=UPI003ED0C69E